MLLRSLLLLSFSITNHASPALAQATSGPYEITLDSGDFGRDSQKVKFFIRDGRAFLQDDIALPLSEEQIKMFEAQRDFRPGDEQYGVGLRLESSRWQKATVPYEIDAGVPQSAAIAQAIAHIEQHTPVRFVRRTTETDYVRFEPGTSNCWSYLGRVGGRQPISLSPGCDTGTIIHEIGHALGLHHEQNRNDRDNHITILWENIDPDYHSQFQKAGSRSSDLGNYDVASIMHYGSYYFSVNQKPSMLTKSGGVITPNRSALSEGDKASIKAMYGGIVKPISAKEQLTQNLLRAVVAKVAPCQITYRILDEAKALSLFHVQLLANNESTSIQLNLDVEETTQKVMLDALIPDILLLSCKRS